MPPETKYAKSGDVHIAYQVIGNGPIDLVVVPGWVSHLELIWEIFGVEGVSDIGLGKAGVGAKPISNRLQKQPSLEEAVRVRRLGARFGRREVRCYAAISVNGNEIATCSAGAASSAAGGGGKDLDYRYSQNDGRKYHDAAKSVHNKPFIEFTIYIH